MPLPQDSYDGSGLSTTVAALGEGTSSGGQISTAIGPCHTIWVQASRWLWFGVRAGGVFHSGPKELFQVVFKRLNLLGAIPLFGERSSFGT
jgi:hypothetical protein